MLQMQDIHKRYGERTALSAVGLRVRSGSIYGLLGTNGAGKTTLMKIAAGILRRDGGTVTLFGEFEAETAAAKERLQFMPDAPGFPGGLRLKDLSVFYRGLYPQWEEARLEKLLNGFGLETGQPLKRMSKGQQRLASFALSLSARPQLMLLDEPFDGLDPVMRHQMKNLLVQETAENGVGILISSHNLRELEDFCDTVGLLHQGKMLLQAELDTVKEDLHKVQLGFSGPAPEAMPEGVEVLHLERRGSVWLTVVRGKREQVVSRLGALQPLILDVLPLTLEEVFIYEMGGQGYGVENILL